MGSAAGTSVELLVGEYKATLYSVGAAIGSLSFQGRDLVLSDNGEKPSSAFLGKTLIPWPNRIAEGKYSYGGHNYEVPINEHSTGAALHGLACWVDWEITDRSADSVTFSTTIAASPAYPFTLNTSVTYRLDAHFGLETTIRTRNVGAKTAPYGVSSHPYLTCNNRPIDECELSVPAGTVLEVDKCLAPVKKVTVDQAGLDYREAHTIAGQQIDHAFTELPDGKWFVDLHAPQTKQTVRIVSDEPWVQIYSGDNTGRIGVAVEPMTCPPNAFNSKEDIIELKPGEETVFHFQILEI